MTWPAIQPSKSRLLVTLILDTSDSMKAGDAIGQLNSALGAWREQLSADANLRLIGEIALVSFGHRGVRTLDPTGGTDEPDRDQFVPIDRFNPPSLTAGGFSPMVKAIKQATRLAQSRRQALAGSGIQMAYRPLVYLLTDGAPTDDDGEPCERWRDLAQELRRQEELGELRFFAFGVRGADSAVLRVLAPDGHLDVNAADFTHALTTVRQSIERAAKAGRPGGPGEPSMQDQALAWFEEQTRRG